MRRVPVLLLLPVLVAGCTQVGGDAPSPTTAAEIAGVWQGDLTQNGGTAFSVKVTVNDALTEGQQAATVQYRGIGGPGGCSGSWVYTDQKDGSWRFAETIDDPGGSCASGSTVTLTPAQDAVLQYLSTNGSTSANGFLSRP